MSDTGRRVGHKVLTVIIMMVSFADFRCIADFWLLYPST